MRKFLGGVKRALWREEPELWEGMRAQQVENLCNKLGRKEWNVRIPDPYRHGTGVVTYLARYVKGGPISNRSLVDADGETVKFRYRDHRDGKVRQMVLKPQEFVRRVLWHVPERGMDVVRHYRLYGRGGKELREKCPTELGQPLEETEKEKVEELSMESYWEKTGHPEKLRCPVCGEPLVIVELIVRGGLPPDRPGDGNRPIDGAQDRRAA